MTALTKLHGAVRPGVVLVCVGNTRDPSRAGRTLRVTGDMTPDGGVECELVGSDEPAKVYLPVRKHGVNWLTDDTVKWPLAKTGRLSVHTVTYRIEDPA